MTRETSSSSARRRRRSASQGVVAVAVAGVLATGTFLGFLISGAGASEMSSENISSDVAVPAAVIDAANQGFADRSEDVSRNAVRSNLADAAAGESAKDRDTVLEESVDNAHEAMTEESAAERDKLMDADLKLVEAQAEKLKKEAEEAEKRLEEARNADKSQGGSDVSVSAEDLAAVSSSGGSMPLKSNYRIGAHFGQRGSWSRYHTGQDFPAPVGTPIYAAASGIVLSPTAGSWAGTNAVIKHSNGGATLYAHMSSTTVSPGQAVEAGQLIGYVGLTGRTFGAHLHFEYYSPGTTPGDVYSASDPMAFLRSLGVG